MRSRVVWVAGLFFPVLVAAGQACKAYDDELVPSKRDPLPEAGPLDAGTDAVGQEGGGDAAGDAGSTFCEQHSPNIFCDDFEGADLATRWETSELGFGMIEVLDGVNVGRPGKVLRVMSTKPGGLYDPPLRIRKTVGAALAVRVSFDMRFERYELPNEPASPLGGNVVAHDRVSTWLVATNGTQQYVLVYSTPFSIYQAVGSEAGLSPPNKKWEHYEIVVVPGNPMKVELWIGTAPLMMKRAELSFDSNDAGFSPTYAELGFEKLNADKPAPTIEAYFDNYVMTAP